VPVIALTANYYLNFRYMRLWNLLDPPKPEDADDLSLKEVLEARQSDFHFDQWNAKYYKVAAKMKKVLVFWSHKMFQLPFTHFYGYLQFTVRSQDYYQAWEWDLVQWSRWKSG